MSEDKKQQVDSSQSISSDLSSSQDQVVLEAQKKIQKAKEDTENLKKKLQDQAQQGQPNPMFGNPDGWAKVVKPKYEIELYDEDTDPDTGEVIGYKKVLLEHPIYIEAATKADMMEHARRYKLCHQRMKVIRKVEDQAQQSQQRQIQAQGSVDLQVNTEQSKQEAIQKTPEKKSKPKYFRLGDIEVKEDNGKLFQKQWIRLSESEASNIRLINDKNNSLVNVNGKHFEMKKWIQVESAGSDDSSNLEEALND